MAGMYPDNETINIFGQDVSWPGVDPETGKFTNGDFTDPLKRPSFIPAETVNLVLDNMANLIASLGETPNNSGTDQLSLALSKKANIASPVFVGTPKVPSKASAATSDGTLVATEAQVALKANTASPTFTGTPKVPSKTSAATSDGTLIATEAQVKAVADSNAQKACANELLSNPALLNAGDGSALPGGLYTISDGSSLGLGGSWKHVMHLRHTHGNGFNAQIAIPFSDPYGLQVRAHDGVSWSPWRKAAFLENDYSRIAVVAKTSDPYDADLPIGSYIACCANDSVQRALNSAVIQPRIQSQGQYVVSGNLTLLSGTWRNSGTSGKASNEYILLRRVA